MLYITRTCVAVATLFGTHTISMAFVTRRNIVATSRLLLVVYRQCTDSIAALRLI